MTDLAKRYRDMETYRLAQLATNDDSLVPEAREALRAEIARRGPEVTPPQPQSESAAPQKNPLDGVEGWLFWYCLSLFGATYRQVRLAVSLRAGSGMALAFATFSLAIAVWDLVTAICVIRRTRFALKTIYIQLTVSALQGIALVVLGISLLTSFPGSAELAVAVITLGLSVGVGYAIWFRYFQVSERVKATFGRNL